MLSYVLLALKGRDGFVQYDQCCHVSVLYLAQDVQTTLDFCQSYLGPTHSPGSSVGEADTPFLALR